MGRRLREACYSMWRRRDKLHLFPVSRPTPSYELETRAALDRAWAYWKMTSGPGRLSRNRACIVLSISTRTAYRYEAWIRQQEREGSGDIEDGRVGRG